jgi:transketolase N-terminal domain/subunit
MLESMIIRFALSAGQKSAASLITRIGTATVSSYVGQVMQNKIAKNDAQIIKSIGVDNISEDEFEKLRQKTITKSSLANGLSVGVGMIVSKAIIDVINKS